METILLVEDDPLTRWVVSRALLRAGFLVLEARDATESQVRIEASATPIALFVIDALLSGRLGSEVGALLRTKNPQIPILYLSGYDADVLDSSQLEREDCHVLPHALVGTQLVSRIRQILARTAFASLELLRP